MVLVDYIGIFLQVYRLLSPYCTLVQWVDNLFMKKNHKLCLFCNTLSSHPERHIYIYHRLLNHSFTTMKYLFLFSIFVHNFLPTLLHIASQTCHNDIRNCCLFQNFLHNESNLYTPILNYSETCVNQTSLSPDFARNGQVFGYTG